MIARVSGNGLSIQGINAYESHLFTFLCKNLNIFVSTYIIILKSLSRLISAYIPIIMNISIFAQLWPNGNVLDSDEHGPGFEAHRKPLVTSGRVSGPKFSCQN